MASARMWRISSTSYAATGPAPASGERVAERGGVAAVAAGEHLVEGDEAGEGDLPERGLELVLGEVELVGQLGVGGRAVQLALERGVRLLERPRLGPHGAGHPVDRAELVEDVPLDPGDGVGLELEAALEVELLDGVDEPEDAVGHEIGLVDALRAGPWPHGRRRTSPAASSGRSAGRAARAGPRPCTRPTAGRCRVRDRCSSRRHPCAH